MTVALIPGTIPVVGAIQATTRSQSQSPPLRRTDGYPQIYGCDYLQMRTLSFNSVSLQLVIANMGGPSRAFWEENYVLRHLEHIVLNRDTAERVVRSFPNLKSIVGGFEVDGSFLEHWALFPRIERLCVTSDERISTRNLAQAITYFPGLRILLLHSVEIDSPHQLDSVQDYFDLIISYLPLLEYAEMYARSTSTRSVVVLTRTRVGMREGKLSFLRGERDRFSQEWISSDERDMWDFERWPRQYGAVF